MFKCELINKQTALGVSIYIGIMTFTVALVSFLNLTDYLNFFPINKYCCFFLVQHTICFVGKW